MAQYRGDLYRLRYGPPTTVHSVWIHTVSAPGNLEKTLSNEQGNIPSAHFMDHEIRRLYQLQSQNTKC